jgi:hypothetical protein
LVHTQPRWFAGDGAAQAAHISSRKGRMVIRRPAAWLSFPSREWSFFLDTRLVARNAVRSSTMSVTMDSSSRCNAAWVDDEGTSDPCDSPATLPFQVGQLEPKGLPEESNDGHQQLAVGFGAAYCCNGIIDIARQP